AKQIGNAVPPLLAYQVARSLGEAGAFVDLFAGAGGLSLGFTWAGWQPLVATDIDPVFLSSYARNIHDVVIPGDLRSPPVFEAAVGRAIDARSSLAGRACWVLGGPPCQGFSTAGNRRSMEDERNHLFRNYRDFLDAVQPDGFVFENVSGLLSMEAGRVYELVKSTLKGAVDHIELWSLRSERFGVPQRRHRLFLVGWNGARQPVAPAICTADPRSTDAGHMAPWISVVEAIDDLPELVSGQDGSALGYRHEPITAYQRLMRGILDAEQYLSERAPLPVVLIA
ncbi:MAG: DNA cytosine methyltransferase, partial [Dehalococcoidia bacterium]